MRKSVQPEYYQATVTCNCGNRSIQASRRLTRLVAVSRSSIRSTELTISNTVTVKAGVLKPRPFC